MLHANGYLAIIGFNIVSPLLAQSPSCDSVPIIHSSIGFQGMYLKGFTFLVTGGQYIPTVGCFPHVTLVLLASVGCVEVCPLVDCSES